jgi:hypothetical protein
MLAAGVAPHMIEAVHDNDERVIARTLAPGHDEKLAQHRGYRVLALAV